MKFKIELSKKLILTGIAAFSAYNLSYAQSIQEGVNLIESYKFAKAKDVLEQVVNKEANDKNLYYLGYTFLAQPEPDYAKATEYFNKGVALDAKKSFYSRLGLASVKLGKGDKSGAIADFASIAKDSREKDPELLYKIGEALEMFPNSNDPRLAIEYLNKAIDKSQKDASAVYFYTLGDANRVLGQQTKSGSDYGNAMTAYEKALPLSRTKAVVYTRMATLWLAAKAWDKAKENLDKAIAADAGFAPAYKALGTYYSMYQDWKQASVNYKKYMDLADNDPNTILDYAKLAFLTKDYTSAASSLDSVFDKIQDPIKYRLKAYLQYQNKDYANAKSSLEMFLSKADKSRILPSDTGLMGLLVAAEAKASNNTAQLADAKSKIEVAKAAKDTTFDWDEEFAIASGSKKSMPKLQLPSSGASNDKIEALKKQFSSDPKDTGTLFNLANEYQAVQNWEGAAFAWQQLTEVLPTWEAGYYGLGFAFQKLGDKETAIASYERYIEVLSKKSPADKDKAKETLASVYFNLASLSAQDKAKSLEYIDKSIETFSTPEAVALKNTLSK